MAGWRLESIVANRDGTITLTFRTPSGPAQASFDSLKITAIAQLGYGTNSKLHLQFDNRYWNGQGSLGNRRRVHRHGSYIPETFRIHGRRSAGGHSRGERSAEVSAGVLSSDG
jgi:hypothetical protein